MAVGHNVRQHDTHTHQLAPLPLSLPHLPHCYLTLLPVIKLDLADSLLLSLGTLPIANITS